jgi:hypothetical protein
MSHIDATWLPMKKKVTDAFQIKLKDVICCNYKKMKALINFVIIFPKIESKAATLSNILHRFIESGLLDRESE